MSSMSNERYAAHYLETILGQKMNLIPYTKEYVPQFNQWLQDPEMQQLVATPAVSLETEYAFQEETAHSTDRTNIGGDDRIKRSYVIDFYSRYHQVNPDQGDGRSRRRCGSLLLP